VGGPATGPRPLVWIAIVSAVTVVVTVIATAVGAVTSGAGDWWFAAAMAGVGVLVVAV
jgi:hypothetical protein